MIAVERIAAAGEIVVIPLGGEQVVDVVVKALEGEEGAHLIALGGVVEHHVQVYLDPPLLAGPDEVFQLVPLPVILGGGGVAGVGGEKAHRAVAPVVIELLPVHLPVVQHLVELENGHELNGVHPQLLKVVQLFHQSGEGAGAGHPRGGVLGEAAHVELVDDEVLRGDEGLAHIAPVKVVLHHPGLVVLAMGSGIAPAALAGDRLGVGVQQIAAFVKNQALFRLVGAVNPVGVLKFLDVQLEHNHGVHIADAVVLGEGEDGEGLVLRPVEQQQLHPRGPVGVDGEVHAAGDGGGAVGVVKAGTHVEPGDVFQGDQMDGAGQHHAGLHLGAQALFRVHTSIILPEGLAQPCDLVGLIKASGGGVLVGDAHGDEGHGDGLGA